jgi:hypothetical protein
MHQCNDHGSCMDGGAGRFLLSLVLAGRRRRSAVGGWAAAVTAILSFTRATRDALVQTNMARRLARKVRGTS